MILGFTLTALLGTVFTNMQVLGTGVASVVKNFDGIFNSLPMLAVALIGFALAAISYKNGQMIPSGPMVKKIAVPMIQMKERLKMTKSNYKLTKEDFKQINRRSLFYFSIRLEL